VINAGSGSGILLKVRTIPTQAMSMLPLGFSLARASSAFYANLSQRAWEDNMALEEEILRFLQKPDKEKFEAVALRLYEHQRSQNPVYSRYCEFFEQPEAIDSWKKIPAVPQQAFKYSELRSFPANRTAAEFRTSGTTGQGYGKHFLASLRLYQAAVRKGWHYFQLPRHPFILLMQDPEKAEFSSLSRMGGILSNYRRDSFFVNNEGVVEVDRLRLFLWNRTEPVTVFGTALAFLNLLEENVDLPLPSGSMVMETGGFKGMNHEINKEDLYAQLSRCFHVDADSIWNEYGMTELSSQFYSRGMLRPHFAPPWLRFLIINPNTNMEASPGEVGLLRIFDLANLWSVLAVQTQDLAVAQSDEGFLLLGRDPAALPRGCSRAMDELIRRGTSMKRENHGISIALNAASESR
jgi:acyl-protein synthetase LuxE